MVNISNLKIRNRIHTKGHRVIDAWKANYISLDSLTIENCNLRGESTLIWFHEEAKKIYARGLNLKNTNNSKYSIISDSPQLELENINASEIKLNKSALIDNQKLRKGNYKNIIEK